MGILCLIIVYFGYLHYIILLVNCIFYELHYQKQWNRKLNRITFIFVCHFLLNVSYISCSVTGIGNQISAVIRDLLTTFFVENSGEKRYPVFVQTKTDICFHRKIPSFFKRFYTSIFCNENIMKDPCKVVFYFFQNYFLKFSTYLIIIWVTNLRINFINKYLT